jgi:hypothetical protein
MNKIDMDGETVAKEVSKQISAVLLPLKQIGLKR